MKDIPQINIFDAPFCREKGLLFFKSFFLQFALVCG